MLLDANSTRWFAELARLRNLTLVGEPAPGSLESIHSLLQIGRLTVDASGLEGPAIDALLEIPWLRRVTLKNLRSPVLSIESLAASKSVQRIDLEDAVLSVDDVRWLQQLGGSKFWSWGATTAFETRRAATEVIRQGGRLEIATSNGMLNVDRVGAIPDEPFQIRSVVLSGESNSALPNLRGLFGIRKLQIQGPGIGDRHLRVIADLTSLTSLSVLDADCTNKGLASLASLVHLEKIDLRDLSGCTHVGLEQLFRATTKLTGIATNSIPLSDGCYQALEDDQELTSLIMHCHTGHETTDELFSSLVKLKKLKDLHLGTPGITGSRLGELEQCPDLLHLYLPRQIETDAIRELTRLPQLTVVGISDATPEKVKIVMHLPNLVELSVFGGELHDGDFKRIFKSRLQSIHLRNVDVDDQMVLEHVDSNSDLKSLTLNLTLASDQLASAVRDRLPNCEVKIIESRTEPHRHKSNRWARSINVPVLDLKRLSGLIQTQNWDALQTAADQQVEAIRSANPDGAESEVELEISKQLHQIADQLRVADYLRAETYFMEAAKHADLAIELEPTSEAFFRALQSWQMVSFARTRDRAVVGCLATLRLHLQSPPQGWMKEDLDDWFRCAAKVYRWRREFRDGELGDFSVDEMPGRIERWLDTFGSDTASAKDFERYFSVIDDYAWAVAELDCRRAADLAATGLQNWEVGLRRFESLNNYNPGFGGNAVRFYLMAGDSTSAQATSELNLRLLTKYFESNRGRWIEKWIASSLVASTLLDVFQGRRAEAEKSVQEMIAKGSATWTPTTRRDLIVLLGTVAPNELPENIANELLEGVDPKLDAATIFDLRLMVASLEADREKIDRLLDTETRTPTPLSRAIRFHVGRTLAGEDNAPKPDLSHSQDPTNWNTTVAICSARLVNGWDGMPLHVSWRRDTDAAKSDDTTGSAER